MRRSLFRMFLFALIPLTQVGCGTLHNLHAPPLSDEPIHALGAGPGICIPFGGVARSGLMGMAFPQFGIAEVVEGELTIFRGNDAYAGFTKIGNGLMMTGMGIGAVLDVPVSLAGDIVTLPLAYARQQQYPWATWWGRERGVCWLSWFPRGNEAGEEKTPAHVEQSHRE